MAVRMVVGAALSALALLLWGFVYWVLLSAPGAVVRGLPDEAAAMAALARSVPESGTYVFPLPPTSGSQPTPDLAAEETFRQRHMAGPLGMLSIRLHGNDPLSPTHYAKGFLHAFAASLIAALLLAAVLPIMDTYALRLCFVFGLGLFAGVSVRLSDPIWWQLPWGHFIHGAVYHAVSWLIAGLVLAGLVTPSRGMKHYTDPGKPLWKRALDVE